MRIYLDANVLFPASKGSGAMRAFLLQLESSGHTLVADGYVIEEARRNLEAKIPTAIEAFEALMKQLETCTKA